MPCGIDYQQIKIFTHLFVVKPARAVLLILELGVYSFWVEGNPAFGRAD